MPSVLPHRALRNRFVAAYARDAREGEEENPHIPKNGYFSEVDVNAPLYKPIVGRGGSDVSKRSSDPYESDFIWNTNWQDKMRYQEQQAEKAKQRKAAAAAGGASNEPGSGELGLSRVSDLNDMTVDLSAQLSAPRPSLLPPQPPGVAMNPVKKSGRRYLDPPTAGENKRWARSSGYIKRGLVMAASTSDETDEVKALRELEAKQYAELQQEYSRWTLATAVVCFTAALSLYTRDVAASYLIGALGGILYLRLLNRSVDGLGAESLSAALGSAASQPRLLIPVILVLVYNRYNFLYADSFGIHLELLPMLTGFFTYKAGVIGRGGLSLFRQLAGKPDNIVPGQAPAGTSESPSLASASISNTAAERQSTPLASASSPSTATERQS